MSNPVARKRVEDFTAEYAETHNNSDYLHVLLGDGVNTHCECEEYQKKIPSDWYVVLLNEIDEALTAKGLNTRIVYIAYTETMWAPEKEKLKNSERFALLFAPITRQYSHPLEVKECDISVSPHVRNSNELPNNFEVLIYIQAYEKED